MVKSTLVRLMLLQSYHMASEPRHTNPVTNMKEIGKMVKNMEKGSAHFQMDQNMMETFKMANFTEMAP